MDEHSYAQPGKCASPISHWIWRWISTRKSASGSATYTLDWLDKTAAQLVLDTRDLTIAKANTFSDGTWMPLQKFVLSDKGKILGSALTIETPSHPAKVRVTYVDIARCFWPTMAGTGDDRRQAAAIHVQPVAANPHVRGCRCKTPQVRFTYSAHITAPKDAMVLMSADNDPNAVRDGDYSFKMPQKIPSYLLAIAADAIWCCSRSPRSGDVGGTGDGGQGRAV